MRILPVVLVIRLKVNKLISLQRQVHIRIYANYRILRITFKLIEIFLIIYFVDPQNLIRIRINANLIYLQNLIKPGLLKLYFYRLFILFACLEKFCFFKIKGTCYKILREKF